MLRLLAIVVSAVLFIGVLSFGAAVGAGFLQTTFEDESGIPSECAEVLAGAFVHTVEAQRSNERFYTMTDEETTCLYEALGEKR